EVIADQLIDHFQARGVKRLYISVDIDGTDEQYAAATGTPESGGLPPWQVRSFIRHLGAAFPLAGADLVEVAPSLSCDRPGEPELTLDTGLAYLEELGRLLRVELPAHDDDKA
ncbi:MAG: arginase family protein, partial [Myxococcota bacterium]|nr:arginase family protein [Myxococcota bacterium]